MDGSYCYYDSIKSLKLYYDAERDSMVESHQAVSDAHWIPFFSQYLWFGYSAI